MKMMMMMMTKEGKNLRFNKEKNCKCGKIIKKKSNLMHRKGKNIISESFLLLPVSIN